MMNSPQSASVRRVAITGASGFVGRVLTDAAHTRGWTIHALSRHHPPGPDQQGVQWFRGDLLHDRPEDFRSFLDGTEALFHCAAELTDESVMDALHVKGTERLIDASRGHIRYWIQLSSCGVYGRVHDGVIAEDAPLRPVGEYETTKLRSDECVMAAADKGAFRCTILRPSIVYGEGMTNQSLRSWIRAVERGLFFFIGSGGTMANYVHAEDVAEALCLCAESGSEESRIYNLSAGCSVRDFVSAICESCKCRKPSVCLPESVAYLIAALGRVLPGFPLTHDRVNALSVRARYDCSRIRSELGFEPGIDASEGIARLVKTMQNE